MASSGANTEPRDEFHLTEEQWKDCLEAQRIAQSGGLNFSLREVAIKKGYLPAGTTSEASPPEVPGFKLDEVIGRGAMGVVYRARQTSLDRVVAVKVLHARLAASPRYVERFMREARLAAKLDHPNAVRVFLAGRTGAHCYLVMEYVEGPRLSDLLRAGVPMEEREALHIIRQVASALAHAHRQGIVHRDIKPSNVILTGAGVSKLADLGLAKEMRGPDQLTQEGATVGTSAYMSPEQCCGDRHVNARSDIYSLGATLYHMLAGYPPFTGSSRQEVMRKHVEQEPESVRERNARITLPAAAIAHRMLAKAPKDRYPSAEDLLLDINEYFRQGREEARTPAAVPVSEESGAIAGEEHREAREQRPMSRKRLLIIGLVILVAAAAAVVLFLRHFRETPQQIVKAAQAYAAAGDYQRALEQYKSLNAKFPASVEARAADPVIKQIEKEVEAQKLVKLGANLNKQGNPRKAVETYSAVLSGFAGTRAAERAAQLDRQARDSAHSLALAAAKDLLAKSDWEGARKAAEEALYFLPGSQEAAAVHHHALYRLYRDRGEEALRQGRKPEALDLLKKALEYNHAPDLVRIVAAIEAELGSSKLLASLIPQIQGSPPGEWQWLQEMIAGLRPGIDGIWEAVRNPARAGITKSHTRAELMLALHNLGEKEALPQLLQLLDGRAPAGFTLQGEPEGLYAAAALAKMGLSSLPLLAERLKADNLPRAVWCARALARLGAAAVEPLAAGAASEDAQLSGSCFDALKQIGKPASEALALLLNDARVDIRKRARAVLVSLGPQAAEGIFAMLPRAAKVGLEEAVGALADMGPPVVPNLVVAHARRPGLERLTADRVLGYVGEEALPYLLTAIAAEDKATRSAALEMVRAQGGKLTAGLLEAAEGKDPIPENIRLALDTLDQLAVPTLLTAFRSSSLKTRKTAELFLAALGPRALSGLMQIVQSPQIPLEIRQRALELAGRIGPTAIPSLALVLQSDAPALADAARHIIIRFGEEAVPYLRTLLRDDSATTRLRAMLLLWDIKGEAALPDVKSMLQDPSENVRLVAVELVGKAAGEQPVDVLVPLLRDKSARVRSAVVDTLAKLGGAKAVRALVMALDGWAPSSLDELKRLILGFGEQAIPALREACYNKNFGARGDVLDILARIGSPAAWDVLAVALDDDDPLIREKAARCLGNSAKTVFVPTLLRHIRDGAVAVRAAVVEALGNLGDRQAVDEIANRLKVDFPVVRLAAVEALAKLGGPEALAALVQAAKQDPSEAVRRAARAALQRMNPAAFGGTLLAP